MSALYPFSINRFWNHRFWLAANKTWEDVHPDVSFKYLLYPLPIALAVLMVRHLTEKYLIAPIGARLGISNFKPPRPRWNPILEKAFMQSNKWNFKQIQGLAKQTDLTERQVERWLRLANEKNRPSTLTKFCENSWRCLYYTSNFVFGLSSLWKTPWLWDINECWTDFPNQAVPNDIWWYYILTMSFYWSLLVSQFFDIKRKDFWQMFIHHIIAILLMSMCWIVNFFRIGSLSLVLHDFADIFLESAKAAKYAKYQKLCDSIFIVFTVAWLLTRVGLYPFWLMKNAIFDATKMIDMFPAYYIFNALLCFLLVLHCVWTYMILKIVVNSLKSGKMEKDIRSSSDEFSEVTNDDSLELNNNQNKKRNNEEEMGNGILLNGSTQQYYTTK